MCLKYLASQCINCIMCIASQVCDYKGYDLIGHTILNSFSTGTNNPWLGLLYKTKIFINYYVYTAFIASYTF